MWENIPQNSADRTGEPPAAPLRPTLAPVCGGVEGGAALGHGARMLIPITDADGILLDLRYASVDNLLGRAIYGRAVALLRPPARDALLAAARHAAALGLKLKVFDAFRPLEAQWAFWHAAEDKTFVADPRGGGTHPRGIAVDLTLADAVSGEELAMGTGFDDFTPLSAHDRVEGLPAEAIRNRALLLGLMTARGWEHYGPEWWHYHLPGRDNYPALSAADVPNGPMDAAP